MLDHLIHELASRQYGCFNRTQILELGGDDLLISRRLASGAWGLAAPGVYSLPGYADSWYRHLWIAHLDVGLHSVVSHDSAARLHRLELFLRSRLIVLSVPHGNHHRSGPFELHQSTDLQPHHVTRIMGLPVTTPLRTLFDLAATCRPVRFDLTVDEALSDTKVGLQELHEMYDELHRPGKKGMRLLGQVLSANGAGYVPPDSMLNRYLRKAVDLSGERQPEYEASMPWRPPLERRVDARYHPELVILEADGRRYHERKEQMRLDRQRDREAQLHRHDVYRFVWEELRREQEMCAETISSALTLARAEGRRVSRT